ncbi:hypothetical protein EHR03_12975 [Leptospira mayottensis]|uniref:Uncharacterized protein n=1 Tax=Leptospira mayottensis 200901116 TaxID=1192864 RepID=M6V6M8_9LEPT|nr:hypothetical protein [Leptospira mayottensis]AVH81600.1 hypothetical protein [Leptospira mayottensis 200901116]TGN00337.1 hypothetical protein EHR03_12975 [Leptospira mayottensis]
MNPITETRPCLDRKVFERAINGDCDVQVFTIWDLYTELINTAKMEPASAVRAIAELGWGIEGLVARLINQGVELV